jgi:hypothetical protein
MLYADTSLSRSSYSTSTLLHEMPAHVADDRHQYPDPHNMRMIDE